MKSSVPSHWGDRVALAFEEMSPLLGIYPRWMYGTKLAILPRILALIPPDCRTFLDAFAGSGIVAYAVKRLGIKVITNDILRAQCLRHRVLVKNNTTILSDQDLATLLKRRGFRRGPYRHLCEYYERLFIQKDLEFIGTWASNIPALGSAEKQDMAVLSAIMALHRHQGFAKTNWTPHGMPTGNRDYLDCDLAGDVVEFARDTSPQLVYDNGKDNEAYSVDAVCLVSRVQCDVAYFDTPYVCAAGNYEADLGYFDDLYRILTGAWSGDDDPYDTKAELPPYTRFYTRPDALQGFIALFRAAEHIPVLILSYNTTSGILPKELRTLAANFGREVEEHRVSVRRPTVVSGGDDDTDEVLLVCTRRRPGAWPFGSRTRLVNAETRPA
jgi:adenine-specific DNA-methyltransferase